MKSLLMGGQACILYGGAEFSRNTDLAILSDAANLGRLREALNELQATTIAVPPFEQKYLDMGLSVHFRCRHPEAAHIRVDVISKMRGVDGFHDLWERRTTFDVGSEHVDALSLPDLVLSKKTQRDKDWPMIARLVEASYFAVTGAANEEQIAFWLRELRTPAVLIEAARRFSQHAEKMAPMRGPPDLALAGDEASLETALREEERLEREADRGYWLPLREELQRLRHEARTG